MAVPEFLAAERRVHDAIARLDPEYREWLRALVRTPSPVGQEQAAQALVMERMRGIGLIVDAFDIDARRLLATQPGFNPSGHDYAGRPCAVGRLTGSGGGRSLVLNAHIDTVPVESPDEWRHPPFAGEVEDGRLYGRGAWDDKAGIAECLLVAAAFREAGVALAGDLVCTSVIEDESTGNGSLACVDRGHSGDGVIIIDGTWPERFIVSHMGQVSFRVRLRGRAGHAASAGPNPIAGVGSVVEALKRFVGRKNAELGSRWPPHERPVFVNVGTVRGGVWSGSVPNECVLEGQYGFPPPESVESARAALQAEMARLAGESSWPLEAAPVIEFSGLETPPLVGASPNAITSLLTNTVARVQCAAIRESIIQGHCDLRHYVHAAGRPTSAACLYGPGGGRNAHATDEWFELAHMAIVARTIASVALAWCGTRHD